MATKQATRKPRGPAIQLPDRIASTPDVVWPGQARGGFNSPLRRQLAEEIAEMEYGSTRHYAVTGEKEQNAFINRFRSVADNVHDEQFGVQAVKQEDGVIIRLWDRRGSGSESE